MKITFWKKILFLVPLIVLRVIGKVILSVLGKHSFVYLIRRYRNIERHYVGAIRSIRLTRATLTRRWRSLPCHHQAYLVVIFLPLALAVTLLALVIKLLRLKLVQLGIEKLLQTVVTRLPLATSPDIDDKIRRLHDDPQPTYADRVTLKHSSSAPSDESGSPGNDSPLPATASQANSSLHTDTRQTDLPG